MDADHVDLTEKLILGEYDDIFQDNEKKYINTFKVTDILDKHNIDKKQVVDIIKTGNSVKPYQFQLLNSAIDVDQLDYLIRDSYYTGVAYGMIDTERFIQTLAVNDDQLVVHRKGVGVIENIIMARALMYSSVYFHKTVRIAEIMLSKAIELIEDIHPFEFFKMTDDELISKCKTMKDFQFEIATRLKYRRLFKQAYVKNFQRDDEEKLEVLSKLQDVRYRRNIEEVFEEKLKIPRGHLIIDVPYAELHLSEPRIDKTDIKIIEDGEIKNIDVYTPTISAIKSRSIPDWNIMIITDEKFKKNVSDNAEKILFN